MVTKKEVAVVTSGDNLPAIGLDLSSYAGMGMEEVDQSSLAIPFLSLLQGLSPQVETVDGAKPGLYIDTIASELMKEVRVIPCAFQRRFIRWAPRSKGGGYKGDYSPADVTLGRIPGMSEHDGTFLMDVPAGQPAFDEKGAPNYDKLSDTRNHYVLYETEEGRWRPALLSLSSTQIKKSKRFMSLISGVELRAPDGRIYTPPSFAYVYTLKALKEKNAKGEWWGVEVSMDGPLTDQEAFNKAVAFNKSVAAGEVQVQEPVEVDYEEASEAKGF
jgi:hypothetical protein